MVWKYIAILSLLGGCSAVLNKRSYNEEQSQYEYQPRQTSPIIGVFEQLSNQLTRVADRLIRTPDYNNENHGNHGHHGHHGHHHEGYGYHQPPLPPPSPGRNPFGNHHHHHHHYHEHHDQFPPQHNPLHNNHQQQFPPLSPFNPQLQAHEQNNLGLIRPNQSPLNPFLNKISFSQNPSPGFQQAPRFPPLPTFPQLPTFPRIPGFPQFPENGNGNWNDNGNNNDNNRSPSNDFNKNNNNNNGCIGFCENDSQNQAQPGPQLEPKNPVGTDALINNVFGGSTEAPQFNNNGVLPTKAPSAGNDLIQSVFPGLGPDGKPKTPPTSQGNDLIQSVFPGLGPDGKPKSPPKSQGNDLIQSVFPGLGPDGKPKTPPTSQGNDLIQSVFPGLGPDGKRKTPPINTGNNNLPTVTPNSDQSAINKDQSTDELIQSIFSNKGTNTVQPDVDGSSTIPQSTTNSEGLIYDIDVRSS